MVEHEKTYKDIPTVALRGLVVLPGEMLHFDKIQTLVVKAPS